MDYSPLVDRIAGEGAAAWDIHVAALAAQARGEDVIVLSIGDPDLETPAPVIERAVSALRDGATHYTDVVGNPELRHAIAAHFADHGGWAARAENVCVVSGAQNGLFFASMLLLRSGDEVIVLDPSYVTYEASIRVSGAEPVKVAPRGDGDFRPDIEAIAAAVTPRTRALLVTNPNNPTGVVMAPDELAAIAEIARRHDLWVISDEVYASLIFDSSHHCIAALPGMAPRTVTVASLSKSHAMTGWRVGWLIAPQAMITHAGNLALCMLYGLPGFVQQAAVTALNNADAITASTREVYRHRRDFLVERLNEVPGLRLVVPEAGMFLMVDVRDTGMRSSEFAWALFREQGVSVLDATAFGASAAGHVRLSYTSNEARLEIAAARLAAFCEARAAQRCAGARHD